MSLFHLGRLQAPLRGSCGAISKLFHMNNSTRSSKDFSYLSTECCDVPPYLNAVEDFQADGRKLYLETYGCQMNFSDASVVRSILNSVGYKETTPVQEADVILLLTCAIRQSAEDKIWRRVNQLRKELTNKRATIGVLGCMANKRNVRKDDQGQFVLPAGVDLVVGPDSYRHLPQLLAKCHAGHKAANIILSYDETYSDIQPVRQHSAAFAYITIMRGCDNMCSYCIVPFTRGREKCRTIGSIEEEFRLLRDQGVKEVTLLGQNVNSYGDPTSGGSLESRAEFTSSGFACTSSGRPAATARFAHLLDRLARIDGNVRIRFTSPHPKDFPDEVLQVMKNHENICKCIHLPAQSGSNAILERMNRGYTVESYLRLVERIRSVLPGVNLTSDFISGFCGETQDDHENTLSLMRTVQYSYCYTFAYSMRQRTKAFYKMVDDVPLETKKRRLQELHGQFRRSAAQVNGQLVGSDQVVIIEKESKRSKDCWMGRTDGNTKVIFPKLTQNGIGRLDIGSTVVVKVASATSECVKGEIVSAHP